MSNKKILTVLAVTAVVVAVAYYYNEQKKSKTIVSKVPAASNAVASFVSSDVQRGGFAFVGKVGSGAEGGASYVEPAPKGSTILSAGT